MQRAEDWMNLACRVFLSLWGFLLSSAGTDSVLAWSEINIKQLFQIHCDASICLHHDSEKICECFRNVLIKIFLLHTSNFTSWWQYMPRHGYFLLETRLLDTKMLHTREIPQFSKLILIPNIFFSVIKKEWRSNYLRIFAIIIIIIKFNRWKKLHYVRCVFNVFAVLCTVSLWISDHTV